MRKSGWYEGGPAFAPGRAGSPGRKRLAILVAAVLVAVVAMSAMFAGFAFADEAGSPTNRRSILVRLKNDANTPDVKEDFTYTDGESKGTVEGNFSVLNTSSQSKDVHIKDFSIYVEWAIGTGRNAWTDPMEVKVCTFDPDADPDAPLFLPGDDFLEVTFACTDLALDQPEGARAIRITVEVEIANKDGAPTLFLNRDSRPL